MFGKLNRRYSDLKRLQYVIQVLIKHGFGYFVHQVRHTDHFIARQVRKWKILPRVFTPPDTTFTIGERLRRVLEELGPTFVKLGQVLSTRPDLIPIEICEEFGKLQDQVPPVSYKEIHAQIMSQFGKPPDELFASFEHTPVAAASLGQVHGATLHDGKEVIVKVQRPHIESVIKADIALLRYLAEVVHRHIPALRIYDLPGIVEQFAKTINKELDFTFEGKNIDKFRKNFAQYPGVYIPQTYWNYTRPKILTLERLHGVKMSEFIQKEQSVSLRKLIAAQGANAILKQIFLDGFFHADPHPGNLFILPENTIAFVDFGIISRLTGSLKSSMCDLLIGVVEHDIDRVVETIIRLDALGKSVDQKKFRMDMDEFLDHYYEMPLTQIRMDQVLITALALIRTYSIKIPRDLYLMVKTIGLAEGLARQLDPEFNMIGHTRPFVSRMIRARYQPKAISFEMRKFMKEILEFGRAAPRELSQIIHMMRQGTFKIEFEHQGLDNLISELDRSSNRIAFSLVIAALIVGSSLMMLTKIGPLVMDIPLFGLIGYMLAAFLGFWLALAILKSGKL